MAVVALTSAKGAPGVTTTALALTLAWPRPALLVEADVSGSSSVLAGYFRGTRKHDRGLIDLAAAHRDGRIEDGVWDSAVPLDEQQKWLLPGLTTSTQSGTMRNLWDPLATVLRSLDTSGIDVIVDAGRSDVHNAPMPLLREADVSLLVSRTDLPSIAAARMRGLRTERVPGVSAAKTRAAEVRVHPDRLVHLHARDRGHAVQVQAAEVRQEHTGSAGE
jgi:hypothetical protein